MNFNLGHSADFHIGESKHILGEDYLLRTKTMLWEILKVIKEKKLKYFVLCGDIFDKSEPLQKEKDLFLRWVKEVDDLGCILILIEGNHDSYSAHESALDYIHILQKKKLKNVRVVIYKPELIEFDDITFCCIPWRFDIYKYSKKLYNNSKKPYVVLGHLPLPGITTDTNWFIEGSHRLKTLKFVDAFLLGDIHKRFISKDGILQMPGAPCQHEWGDKPPKGISLLSTKSITKPELVKLNIPEFIVVKSLKEANKNKDKIVKLVSNEVVEDLPGHIVDYANYFSEEEIVNYESDFKITAGLKEFLANKGVSKKEQKIAIKIVEKLCKEI